MQDATVMRVDTGGAVTFGAPSRRGVGQGCVCGPVRSKLLLAQMQRAVHRLARGYRFAAVGMPEHQQPCIPSVYFADDGSFLTDDLQTLQLVFDVIAAVARAEGLTVGFRRKESARSTKHKTAWSGVERRRDGSLSFCERDREVRWLLDGQPIPRTEVYKHLGTELEAAFTHHRTRAAVQRRCRGCLAAMARLGVLDAV